MRTTLWILSLLSVITVTLRADAGEMLASARIVQRQPVTKEEAPEKPEREIVLAKEPRALLGKFWDSSEFRTVTFPNAQWATDEFIWFPTQGKPLFVGVISEYSISPSVSAGQPSKEPFGLVVGLRFKF